MPVVNGWSRNIALPTMLVMTMMATACIFNFDDFHRPLPEDGGGGASSSGTQGGMGGGTANASNSSSGAGGLGNSGAGGDGGAGAGGPGACPIPTNLPSGVFYTTNPNDPCYVLFYGLGATWENAAKQCSIYLPGANLVIVSEEAEHKKIKMWLAMLGNVSDAWIGGRRIPGDIDPNDINSFQWVRWDLDSQNLVYAEPWLIYPCDSNIKECNNDRNLFWGKIYGKQQPEGYKRCVRYAVLPSWDPKGLDDDNCDFTKPYICEISN